MSWERYYAGKRGFPHGGNLVRASNHYLKFSKEFWEKEWGSSPRVMFYFDKGENKIGVVPCAAQERGTLRILGNGVLYVCWSKFLRIYRIHFDTPSDFKIKKEDRFWVISLPNNGGERG